MTAPTTTAPERAVPAQPDLEHVSATLGGDTQSRKEQIALGVFIVVPFLALVAAVPLAWGGWLGWTTGFFLSIARSFRRETQ